ncbi:MAG: D-aminoacylase [Arenicella sp.]|nr:D-aminoacylase [Arenicella sp.]
MPKPVKFYNWIIRNAVILDGSGGSEYRADVGIIDNRIACIGDLDGRECESTIDAQGLCLAPGFIDVHTHDDIHLLNNPEMLSKISQGVSTVIVGNCGISASPVSLNGPPPDPMNLLGNEHDFVFPRMRDYAAAINRVQPSVNVAALVGHTSLRANHMNQLDRPANQGEILAMREDLALALVDGALGLSSGLSYESAINAPADELLSLAKELTKSGAIYTTHLRSEFEGILDAMKEAFTLGKESDIPVVISHFKCAGVANWGRTLETIPLLQQAASKQEVACDCYPYAASSSTLDLKQVTDDFDIFITWSDPHAEMAGKMLADIASEWNLSLLSAAKKLRPAGAVYHSMDEADVRRVLQYTDCMIGSDGLPGDPHPHPRLWGTFPRVLGHYSRDMKILNLPEAIRKMTGLQRLNLGSNNEALLLRGIMPT